MLFFILDLKYCSILKESNPQPAGFDPAGLAQTQKSPSLNNLLVSWTSREFFFFFKLTMFRNINKIDLKNIIFHKLLVVQYDTDRHFPEIVKSKSGHPKTCKYTKNQKSKIFDKTNSFFYLYRRK